MRIVIATPLYPPQIGGPARYSAELASALERAGQHVSVAVYGELQRYPSGLRHVLYAIRLFRLARGADAIISLDPISVGMPAAFVSIMRKVPLIVRIGGDFVWERYVERTRDLVPLPLFYKTRENWNSQEKRAYRIVRYVLSRSIVVFSSAWQLSIWKDVYGIDAHRAHVIENSIEEKREPIAPAKKNFLFYSRRIVLKNAEAFQRAFDRVKASHPDIELEEGNVSHDELIERIRRAYAVVLPSVSDITPNYILDAIRCGKPFLITTYSAYAARFKEYGVVVDPLSEHDMQLGIERLLDPSRYAAFSKALASFNERRSYDDIAREFLDLLA